MALEKFWHIWSKNYLKNLSIHGLRKSIDISVGSLVPVREDGQSRLTWPTAVATELLPGHNQIVHSCKARFKGSKLKLEYHESENVQALPS